MAKKEQGGRREGAWPAEPCPSRAMHAESWAPELGDLLSHTPKMQIAANGSAGWSCWLATDAVAQRAESRRHHAQRPASWTKSSAPAIEFCVAGATTSAEVEAARQKTSSSLSEFSIMGQLTPRAPSLR